jgi:hypothetical protein
MRKTQLRKIALAELQRMREAISNSAFYEQPLAKHEGALTLACQLGLIHDGERIGLSLLAIGLEKEATDKRRAGLPV